jgi:hypothetical protein
MAGKATAFYAEVVGIAALCFVFYGVLFIGGLLIKYENWKKYGKFTLTPIHVLPARQVATVELEELK